MTIQMPPATADAGPQETPDSADSFEASLTEDIGFDPTLGLEDVAADAPDADVSEEPQESPKAEAKPEQAPDTEAKPEDDEPVLDERALEALAAKSRKLKAEQEEFARQKRELEERASRAETIENAIRNRDYRTLERYGFSADDVINHVLSGDGDAPAKPAEPEKNPEIETLRERLDRIEREKQQLEQAQQLERAQAYIREQVAGSDYAVVNALGAHDAVFQEIVRSHREDGLEMTPRQAAAAVERRLRAQIEAVAKAAPDFLRGLLGDANSAPVAARKKTNGKTITNDMAAETPPHDADEFPVDMPLEELDKLLQRRL